MSLNVALSTAVSSLLLIEKQMGVASNNISNANTAGYSEETVQVAEAVTGGQGTGVTDLGVTSEVNQYLLASVQTATGQSAQATAYNTLYQDLQTALGSITTNETGNNDLASQMSTLQTDLTTLATTPSDTALTTNVVQDLDNITSNLRSMSSQIQTLRTTADQNITDTVNDANTQLNAIASLNAQINTAQASNQSTASLQDLRNNALSSLSADLGVSSYIDSSGMMQVFTTSGQPLLVGNQVVPLSHTAVSIGPNSSYASGNINGIMAGKIDITSSVTSGKLAAYIQMRDTELPNAQSALDSMARQLSSTVNGIYGLSTSQTPPPASITGTNTTAFNGTDTVSAAPGTTVRVALLDSSGNVANYVNVDLSKATAIDDGSSTSVVSLINAALASQTPPLDASASLNSSGQLVLSSTSTSAPGINISTLSGSIGAPGTTGTDFASYFDMQTPAPNQLLTGGASSNTISASNIQVQANILAQPAKLSTGNGSMATMLSEALLQNESFNSTVTSANQWASAAAVPGGSGSFTINTGSVPVSVQVNATDSLQTIADNINAAAAAAGSSLTASLVGNGTTQPLHLQISSGTQDAVTFSAVNGSALSALGISASPAGYLGATSTTLAGYASDIISDIATRANTAASVQTTQSTTLTALQNNLSSQSGVNTDEEMAKLTQLQSSYAASAKIVSTVQTMFNALLQAVTG